VSHVTAKKRDGDDVLVGDIGGEFALIKRLTESQQITDPDVIIGVGDDCAVIRKDDDTYLLVTADMMVEDDHFSHKWYTPEQIGGKLVESNVSDIVSMGGAPRHGIISMSLPAQTTLSFVDRLYEGIYASARRHGLSIIGGDTTRGDRLVLNLTLIGEVKCAFLRTRAMAQEGDLICVTGALGKSMGGLRMLMSGIEGDRSGHLEPRARTRAEAHAIAAHAHAMIDVSDGLASEVAHICEQSNTGAVICRDRIPLAPAAVTAAEALHESAYDYALYGGEDFELAFTMPEREIDALRAVFGDFSIVGRVTARSGGTTLDIDGKREPLRGGFDHFM